MINKVSPAKNQNKLREEDFAAHDWYRFVLSFPPHLVRDCLKRFGLNKRQRVLDPFCGTGTVLVECKKLGISSVGTEPHPMSHFASQVKADWAVDPEGLWDHARKIAERADVVLARQGLQHDVSLPLFRKDPQEPFTLRTLEDEPFAILLKNSISPLPLHRVLTLLDALEQEADERYMRHERLALAKTILLSSNLHFGPEVGVRKPLDDAPVVSTWTDCVRTMSEDLSVLRRLSDVETIVHRADARRLSSVLEAGSVDAVITSPPYPNEKDYTRTTRLESVLLGFIRTKADLRSLKQDLLRSNTRGVYKHDQDDRWVAEHDEIQGIADAIEARRIELGKTSGFERMYARVTKLYFGGMARHLSDLRKVLRRDARLAYVVGDQASYLRVMIRTGQLLADLAKSLGYEVEGIDLFRERLATATRESLREEILFLRWPGKAVSI